MRDGSLLPALGGQRGAAWEGWFRLLGLANVTVLWATHGRALRALGASRAEFYAEVRRELGRFIRQVRREAPVPRPMHGSLNQKLTGLTRGEERR